MISPVISAHPPDPLKSNKDYKSHLPDCV